MFDNFYDDIGGKIKGLAQWIFVIEAVGAIVTGIVLFSFGDYLIVFGVLAIIFGPLVAYVSSWLLYAFGQLVEDTGAIRGQASSLKNIEKYVVTVSQPTANITNDELKCETKEKTKFTFEPKVRHEALKTTKKAENAQYTSTEKNTIICSACNCEQASNRSVCWNCGAKFNKKEESQPVLPCPNCGEDLDFMGWDENDLKERQVCPLCGKDITFNR